MKDKGLVRDVGEEYAINGVFDQVESDRQFFQIALYYATQYSRKYYWLKETPEDMVNILIVNMYNRKGKYDPNKGTLHGYVKTLVHRTYLDALRGKKEPQMYSLEYPVGKEDRKAPLKNCISTRRGISNVEDVVMMEEFFQYLSKRTKVREKDTDLTVRKIIELKLKGYKSVDIAEMYQVKPNKIRRILSRNQDFLWDCCVKFFGDTVTMRK
jgi:RNA polymerase sigma factor (sigma-70 family)